MTVLIANHEPPLSDLLRQVLERRFSKRGPVRFYYCHSVGDVRSVASWIGFDLFILVVNNVFWEGDEPPDLPRRIGAVVACIDELKRTYGKPVVAVSGYWARGFGYRLEAAGADVVLSLPFELEVFGDLVAACLEGLPSD